MPPAFSQNSPRLDSDEAYCAALDEIERLLFLADPETPEHYRLNALIRSVEDYEALHRAVPDWPLHRIPRAA